MYTGYVRLPLSSSSPLFKSSQHQILQAEVGRTSAGQICSPICPALIPQISYGASCCGDWTPYPGLWSGNSRLGSMAQRKVSKIQRTIKAGKDLQDHWVQPSTKHHHINWTTALRASSNHFLNNSRNYGSTASLSSPSSAWYCFQWRNSSLLPERAGMICSETFQILVISTEAFVFITQE